MLQVLKPLGFFEGCIFYSRPPKSRIPGGIRCSSSLRACEGAESDGTVEPLLAVETYRETMTGAEWLWRFEIWSPSHEGLGCFWGSPILFFFDPHPALGYALYCPNFADGAEGVVGYGLRIKRIDANFFWLVRCTWVDFGICNPAILDHWQRPQHTTRTVSLLTRWRRTPAWKDGREETW